MDEPTQVATHVERKHPLAKCELCPLYDNVYVPSAGSDNPTILFIGEAPGSNEAMQGKPFVGASGSVLTQCAGQITDLEHVRYANAVGCHPIGNETPAKAAILACRDRLLDEINTTSPQVVMPMGNVALHSLYGSAKKISKERGKLVELNGFPILPTWHPSYILRDPRQITDFALDLENAVAIVEGTRVESLPEPMVVWYSTEQSSLELLDRLMGYRELNVDIETDSLLDESPRHESDEILCVAFSWGSGLDSAVVTKEAFTERVWKKIRALLERPPDEVEYEWQNGKFDCKFFRAQKGIRARIDFDTMLAHYCLDERKGTHDLEQMAMRFEGAPDWKSALAKTVKKKVKRYSEYPPDALHKYAGYDAAYGRRLAARFRIGLAEAGLEKLHSFLVRTSEMLMSIEMHGVLIDETARQKLQLQLQDEIERIVRDRIWVEAGREINPRANRVISKILFEELGLRVPPKTKRNKDGSWPTNKEVLKQMIGQHPLVESVLAYRSAQKLYATYVIGLGRALRRGNRYWPDHRQHGSVTGRLSGPLTLVMPKPKPNAPNIRSLVDSPNGFVLLEADAGQGELRVATALSHEPLWTDIFRRGGDIHHEMQLILPGMGSMEDALKKENGDESAAEKTFEIWRRNTKTVNFGALYGMEEKKLAQMFGWHDWQAKQFLAQYWERVPVLRGWIGQVQERAISTGRLVCPSCGQVRRYGLVTEEVRKSIMKEASNYYPQHILNEINLETANRVSPILNSIGAYIICPVHDALVTETPIGKEAQVAYSIRSTMIQVATEILSDWIPFEVDIKVGKNWGEMKKLKIDFAAMNAA